MAEEKSRRQQWAEADAARLEQTWGMHIEPDSRGESPERLAYEAYERGDRLFQIDLPVSGTQGRTGVSTASTRTWRPQVTDPLGVIERQGWRLENMSAAFTTGSSATKRIMAHSGSAEVAYHGTLMAVYVFRRAQRTP